MHASALTVFILADAVFGIGALAGLPDELTALNARFPLFRPQDRWSLCFNVRPGDSDSFFQLQGAYIELNRTSCEPLDEKWRRSVEKIASTEGFSWVQCFCTRDFSLSPSDRIFWGPAKQRRWGTLPGHGETATDVEHVLVRGDSGRWRLLAVSNRSYKRHPLSVNMLHRITYPRLVVDKAPRTVETGRLFGDNSSMPAWLDGCTLIVKPGILPDMSAHNVPSIPVGFSEVRFVPLSQRDVFLSSVASKPAFAVSGATLSPRNHFASPLSSEFGILLGRELGRSIRDIRTMTTASMRGHASVMSADYDLTRGFESVYDRGSAHFKGSNLVWLHGDAWKITHGISFVIEEAELDFSGNAKEAALMASASHEESIAILAGGGPTVADNVQRFLLLCAPGHVFACSGFHGSSGFSGATGSFNRSRARMAEVTRELVDLAPGFFGARVDVQDFVPLLLERPLTLLVAPSGTGEVLEARSFVLQPDRKNTLAMPGFAAGQAALLSGYARACAEAIRLRCHLADSWSELLVSALVSFALLLMLPCCWLCCPWSLERRETARAEGGSWGSAGDVQMRLGVNA